MSTLALRFLSQFVENTTPISIQEGGSPIFVAAQCGHLETVNLLLKARASLDITLSDGAGVLFVAAQNGHYDIVKRLLQESVIDVDEPRDVHLLKMNSFQRCLQDGATPLWIASQMGHAHIVTLLIQHGANPDHEREDGATPLFKAAHKGHLTVCEVLLESGLVRLGILPVEDEVQIENNSLRRTVKAPYMLLLFSGTLKW